MMNAVGYYSAQRYEVYVGGECVYTGGNHPFDSQIIVSKENGVGLKKMRHYCIQTTKEIAAEQNVPYMGVSRDEED